MVTRVLPDDMPEELIDDVNVVVTSCAHQLAREYYHWVTADDIRQEMWIWVIKHPDKVRDWMTREEKPERAQGAKALAKTLLRMGQIYCRKEKATKSGYLPQDEYFYTRPLVTALVEALCNEGKMQVNLVDDSTRKSKLDSEGNDVLALLADVDLALRCLEDQQQVLVIRMCGLGESAAEIAAEEGVTRQAVENRLNRALDRMIKELGGEYPYK